MSCLLEQVATHDSVFTAGYWLGYVTAKCESRDAFEVSVPASQVPGIAELLAGAGAKVSLEEPPRGRFGVRWTSMEVRFP